MSMEFLTSRAKDVLSRLVHAKKARVSDFLDELRKSDGYGKDVLETFPALLVPKEKQLQLDSVLKEAYLQAARLNHPYVGTEHLLLAILKLCSSKDFPLVRKHIVDQSMFPRAFNLMRQKKDTVLLDTFGINLNKNPQLYAKEGLVDRDELDVLTSVLLKKERPNPLIVGDAGVGKKSLVNLLVRDIVSLKVPPVLAGYQVIEFDLMAYISSILNKGNSENSLMLLQEELQGLNRVILSIKNFQNLFISTSAGIGVPLLYPIFRDILENAGINFIATMTTSVYDKIILDNDHLLEHFTVVNLGEPPEDITRKILKQKSKLLAEFHNIEIKDSVINHIFSLSKDEVSEKAFPQKGVELLDVACANLLVKKSKVPDEYKSLVEKTMFLYEKLDKTLDMGRFESAAKVKDELKQVESRMNSHEDRMLYSRPLRLLVKDVDEALGELELVKEKSEGINTTFLGQLPKKLKRSIIGQDNAVDTVIKALIRSKLGLRSEKRPVGCFLFLGPTGVGKTEFAKLLSTCAFEENGVEKDHLIRLDMSDFSEKHTVARLVGSPPGYVGYGEGGELTKKIEQNPESVVLFDEIEKAHPDVLNILLQIMEEGELSDAKGTRFDFSQAVIILTSNLGTEILHNNQIGFKDSIKDASDLAIEKSLMLNLKKILRPELINRFDEVIVFRRLNKEDQLQILDLLIKEVVKKLKNQSVDFTITKKAKKKTLELGYSHEYGARALRRTVEKHILDPVAEALLHSKKRPIVLKCDLDESTDSLKLISSANR